MSRAVQSFLIAISCLATFHPAFAQSPASTVSRTTAAKLFQDGQRALQAGDLDAAQQAFRQVLKTDPQSGAAYANLGVIAMRRKDWNAARSALDKAEKLSPQLPGIRLNIGLVEFHRENYAAAIPPLERVVQELAQEDPASQQARYLLGLCQFFTDRFSDATRTLTPLWEELSSDVMYLYVLGLTANKSGDKDLDEKAMNRLLEIGQDTPEFHIILGKAYLQHSEYDNAMKELQKAAQANPRLPFVHFDLGMVYLNIDDLEKAEQQFLQDIPIDPELADNYYQLGVIYSRAQDDVRAKSAFEEALKRDPRRAGALVGLGQIYQHQGKYDLALQKIDEALLVVPASGKVHFVRAQLLQKLGRGEESKAEFQKAKSLLDAAVSKARDDLEEKTVPSPELKQTPN